MIFIAHSVLLAMAASLFVSLMIVLFLCVKRCTNARGRSHKKYTPKSVLVIGGTYGLGNEIAKRMLREDDVARLVILARSPDHGNRSTKELRKQHPEKDIDFCQYDAVNDNLFDTLNQAREAIPILEGIQFNVIFHCVGSARCALGDDESTENASDHMKKNYLAAIKTCVFARSSFVAKRSHIVFIGSTLSNMEMPGYASYCASKQALKAYIRTLRLEPSVYGHHYRQVFVSNMDTPGFKEEQKTKPCITKKVESISEPLDPVYCASVIVSDLYSTSDDTYVDTLSYVADTPFISSFVRWYIRSQSRVWRGVY